MMILITGNEYCDMEVMIMMLQCFMIEGITSSSSSIQPPTDDNDDGDDGDDGDYDDDDGDEYGDDNDHGVS